MSLSDVLDTVSVQLSSKIIGHQSLCSRCQCTICNKDAFESDEIHDVSRMKPKDWL